MSRSRCALALVSSVLIIATVPVRRASAATIDVPPGAGTLQAAIDSANPGDTVRLHPGGYTGAVTVTKSLRFRSAFGAAIDANCEAPVAIDIQADGVTMIGKFMRFVHGEFSPGTTVAGGTTTQIRIADHSTVKVQDVEVAARCGSEQNGIEVTGNSSKVHLKTLWANAQQGNTSVAGVHLNGLAAGARIVIQGTGRGGEAIYDNIGVLIENSAKGAALGRAGIVVERMYTAFDSATAISIVNSDGIVIEGNSVGSSPVGLDLDAMSDNNLIIDNSAFQDGTPFVDGGTGNCGTGNRGFAVPACP
jgi:nitrous oxidase accessory protein NosD